MKKGRVSSVVGILGIVFLLCGIVAMTFTLIVGFVISDSVGIGIIGGIIPSGVFIIVGLVMTIVIKCMSSKRQKLIETGVQAEGTVTNVVRDLTVRVNNAHPFKAECEVVDPVTGAVYLYSSPRIIQDITFLIGHKVTVYYDPDNRKKYFVDIETAIAEATENGREVYDYR
ncbi:MAG: hypothetical protein IJX15_00375 [Ruminiclostridium sp.]|nr:hypothetical protein [Ruminiclostridium sp.]MBQ8842483.1 hypothetical protein [Ruminiclostridium sp.]